MSKIASWSQFTKERFEPLSHLTMIAVFITAHVLIAKNISNQHFSATNIIVLFIAVVAFYFKLRLYDEVKDYELDLVINKHRPLPRGLLGHQDMYLGMIICILIEMGAFLFAGINSFTSVLVPIAYSLLMYKEFFIKDKIRPYLTTYALSHTIVTTFLSLAIFSYLTNNFLINILFDRSFLYFSFANWLLFNVFEFGRKTFASVEERENVDTYSSIFGKTGAVVLVFSQVLIAHYLCLNLYGSNVKIQFIFMGLLVLILAVLSLYYILADSAKSAKLYRLFSSLYIILFYLILIFSYILN